ncbi:MAG: YihY/virulence factor BrkB family protein [Saprospiraceae bacterium]|nr:YihY/virulence factor BrkB family protein [Saprospiraceae bacterium]
MSKSTNIWQKWRTQLSRHPWRLAVLRWSKTHSLPGFFRVPIYDVFVFVGKEIKQYDLFVRANSVAFSFFLSLFPSIMVLFTLLPYLKNYVLTYLPQGHNFDAYLQKEIGQIMPGVAGDRLFNFIDDITNNPRVGLLSFGFFMAIFFSSNGMIMLMRGFSKGYSTTFKNRNPVRKRLIAISLTFVIGSLLVAAVVLMIVGDLGIRKLDELARIDWLTQFLLNLLRWLVIIGLYYFAIAIIHRFGASTRRKFKMLTPGAALATMLCLAASLIFSYYVNHFNTYNELYGSIGTIIVIMLWMQMNSLSILVGYELNASIAVNRDMREQIIEKQS